MGFPKFSKVGVPYRELITHDRYSEYSGGGGSASIYWYFLTTNNTEQNVAWRPFTVSKPGWIFIVACCYAGDYTNATPAQYWVRLYRDTTLLDQYTWTQTGTGEHGTYRIILYGWEYLKPGNYTAYIKAVSNSGNNWVKVLSEIYPGASPFPGLWFPYLISVNYLTAK